MWVERAGCPPDVASMVPSRSLCLGSRHQEVVWIASAFQALVADGLPAIDQVPFLSASHGLTGSRKVHVDMCRAVSYGILQFFMSFKPLVHVASLRYVERDPLTVLRLFGVDIVAW